jgi:hypothetical protein
VISYLAGDVDGRAATGRLSLGVKGSQVRILSSRRDEMSAVSGSPDTAFTASTCDDANRK